MPAAQITTQSLHARLKSLHAEEQKVNRALGKHTWLMELAMELASPDQARVTRQKLAILRRQARLVDALLSALEAEERPAILLRQENLLRILRLTGLAAQFVDAHEAAQMIAALDLLLESLPPIAISRPARSTSSEFGRVVKVYDGDGVLLENGCKVRYIGMDAPEMRGLHLRPEPFAIQSRDLNARLVLGKTVRLVRDVSECDKYGRLLRYVYVGKLFVNAELVRLGAAFSYSVPPDTRQAALFRRLQEEARQAQRGIWAAL